ncbi:PIG-L deacetylase family protein [uncultured Hymenobacter sp.]|uniref:PIG-L deacetylase family protein n=1 Tax=uncultured Hymenobacter sp. TaxID=170016 RepID=UPI0035CA8604
MSKPTPETPFAAYPRRPARFAASLGSTVVVIPHPDDEALGCGGLLALLRRAGHAVRAVLVSDGTMSHPASRAFPPAARRAVRETELRLALSILGVEDENLLTLGLPDSQVPGTGPAVEAAVEKLRDLLREQPPATILVPWRRDSHPDHRATSQLVDTALAGLPTPPRRLEYVVWAWQRAAPADLPRPADAVTGFRLHIGPVLAQKQRAIAAHRSQIAPGVFTDDPAGFLLSAEMLAHFAGPYEVFLEPAAPTNAG